MHLAAEMVIDSLILNFKAAKIALAGIFPRFSQYVLNMRAFQYRQDLGPLVLFKNSINDGGSEKQVPLSAALQRLSKPIARLANSLHTGHPPNT